MGQMSLEKIWRPGFLLAALGVLGYVALGVAARLKSPGTLTPDFWGAVLLYIMISVALAVVSTWKPGLVPLPNLPDIVPRPPVPTPPMPPNPPLPITPTRGALPAQLPCWQDGTPPGCVDTGLVLQLLERNSDQPQIVSQLIQLQQMLLSSQYAAKDQPVSSAKRQEGGV